MKKELSGSERRSQLLSLLRESAKPLSGTELGKQTGVSRQSVVQDIALLRTQGYDISSTARGYVLDEQEEMPMKVFKVCHGDEDVEEELQTIVDLGGNVLDVMVNHRTYGKMAAPMHIKSRRDVKQFIDNLKSSKSSLLMHVTSGYHFHTVSAETEEILAEIEKALERKNYLVEPLDYEREVITEHKPSPK